MYLKEIEHLLPDAVEIEEKFINPFKQPWLGDDEGFTTCDQDAELEHGANVRQQTWWDSLTPEQQEEINNLPF